MIQRIATVAAMAAGLCLLAHGETRAQPLQALPPTGSALPTAPSGQKSRSGTQPAVVGTVIRGADTESLIATLPWWRIDESRPPDGQLESQILTACDLWLGFPFATSEAQSLTVRLAAAQRVSAIDDVTNRINVADPGELNEIDLAAPGPPRNRLNRLNPWWLGVLLLALAGGAAGAFAAARRMFAWQRRSRSGMEHDAVERRQLPCCRQERIGSGALPRHHNLGAAQPQIHGIEHRHVHVKILGDQRRDGPD